MNVTIDSSIFVEAVSKNAIHQQLCFDLIKIIYANNNISIYQPSLFLFEFVSAAVRQKKGMINEKQKRLESVLKLCNYFFKREKTFFIDISISDWKNWSHNNGFQMLHKSQDEIFMYIAIKNKAALITLDHELVKAQKCFSGNCKVYPPYNMIKILNEVKK